MGPFVGSPISEETQPRSLKPEGKASVEGHSSSPWLASRGGSEALDLLIAAVLRAARSRRCGPKDLTALSSNEAHGCGVHIGKRAPRSSGACGRLQRSRTPAGTFSSGNSQRSSADEVTGFITCV
jgi:hypothetical protein